MDDDGEQADGRAERYELGPDGTPVGSGPDRVPDPETAVEHRRAARRALGEDDEETALDHLDEALRLAREAGDDALAAGVLTDRGNVRMGRAGADEGAPQAVPDTDAVREAVEAAVADYTAALDADPENAEALFDRGLARARLGDRAASTADLERAAELDRGKPFLVRGNVYAEAGADEFAREDFTRALESTDTARAYFNRGNANRRLGDETAAVADYEAALDRAGELPDHGLRVLVRVAETTTGERATRSRVRAALLAVAGRDIWRGVSLADRTLADAAEESQPWADAGALVVAGTALRAAAGYGPDGELAVDVEQIRERLAGRPLPDATAALVGRATEGDGGTGALDAPGTGVDLATAVTERDDDALRRAAFAEFGRQLELYR